MPAAGGIHHLVHGGGELGRRLGPILGEDRPEILLFHGAEEAHRLPDAAEYLLVLVAQLPQRVVEALRSHQGHGALGLVVDVAHDLQLRGVHVAAGIAGQEAPGLIQDEHPVRVERAQQPLQRLVLGEVLVDAHRIAQRAQEGLRSADGRDLHHHRAPVVVQLAPLVAGETLPHAGFTGDHGDRVVCHRVIERREDQT